jgi:hypothetical protein
MTLIVCEKKNNSDAQILVILHVYTVGHTTSVVKTRLLHVLHNAYYGNARSSADELRV